MKLFLIYICTALLLIVPFSLTAQDVHDDHEGHDHEKDDHTEQVDTVVEDEHDGHNHGADDVADKTVDAHEDELIVELSPKAVKLAGIKISTVKNGTIGKTIDLPGEIGFNEDRLVHIAPRFAGIAQKVNYRVGDYVEAGNIVAVVESNESMNSYTIKTPISGWVIDRHITPGEFVSEENSIFMIADLSTVWVNLAVYPKDANHIKKGQSVNIKTIGDNNTTTGTIEYITPIMDLRTRSLTARINLANPNNSWRPGSFVQAAIVTETGTSKLVVEKDAVQFIEEKSVVFVVEKPNHFKPVEVVTGESNSEFIHIKSGLTLNSSYVSHGAFEIKAKIITSNMDAHAGHGH